MIGRRVPSLHQKDDGSIAGGADENGSRNCLVGEKTPLRKHHAAENLEEQPPRISGGEANGAISKWNSSKIDGPGSLNGTGVAESKGISPKIREESPLTRNRTVKYSPNNLGYGLLRFYLTPSKELWKVNLPRAGCRKNKLWPRGVV